MTKIAGFFMFLFLSTTALADEDISLTRMIDITKLALYEVELLSELESETSTRFPRLDSAKLTLKTGYQKDASGKLNLIIIKLGGGTSSTLVQTMSLTLEPPKPVPEEQKTTVSQFDEQLQKALVSAIMEGARAIDHAARGKPTLHLNEFKATINFVLKKTGNGSLEIEIGDYGVGVEGGRLKESTQSIELTFKR